MSRPVLHVNVNHTTHTLHTNNPATVRELRKNQVEDRASSRNADASFFGAIATIAAAALAAFGVKTYSATQTNLKTVARFRDYTLPTYDKRTQKQLRPAANERVKTLETQAFWSRTFVVLTVSALGCGLSAFLGGTLAIPSLITAATIGGVVIAASGAFAGVWYFLDDSADTDNSNIEPIRITRRAHHYEVV